MALTSTIRPAPAFTDLPLFRLTIEDYHDLIDRGRLTPNDPVELIEGVLVYKMPTGPVHAETVELMAEVISAALPGGWRFRSEKPITLFDTEPAPDGVITSLSRPELFKHHPRPSEIAIVFEVSDSTLGFDRGDKLNCYARACIPIYWIVNLIDRQVEVYTHPAAAADEPAYEVRSVHTGDDPIAIVVAGQTVGTITPAMILPPI